MTKLLDDAVAIVRRLSSERQDEIAAYITRVNPNAARSVGAAIAASQRLIAEHPGIGRRQQGRDLRKLVVPRYGYLIYYRVIERADLVAIATIRHPSRARIISDA